MDIKHKVFLFGSHDVFVIPPVVEDHLRRIIEETKGNVEFIVGDASGVDAGFQKSLARLGQFTNTTVYCMDKPRNNKFDLPIKVFDAMFDSEAKRVTISCEGDIKAEFTDVNDLETLTKSRDYYSFKDKQMQDDCTFAICIWDKESRGTFSNINRLKALNKYVYVYTV